MWYVDLHKDTLEKYGRIEVLNWHRMMYMHMDGSEDRGDHIRVFFRQGWEGERPYYSFIEYDDTRRLAERLWKEATTPWWKFW